MGELPYDRRVGLRPWPTPRDRGLSIAVTHSTTDGLPVVEVLAQRPPALFSVDSICIKPMRLAHLGDRW